MGKAVVKAVIGAALIAAAPFAGSTFAKFLISAGMSGLRFRDATGATWIARGARRAT